LISHGVFRYTLDTVTWVEEQLPCIELATLDIPTFLRANDEPTVVKRCNELNAEIIQTIGRAVVLKYNQGDW
jgi:hypothetical protein